MAKLYNPAVAGQYVWPVHKLDDRSRPPKTLYVADPQADWSTTTIRHTHGPVDDSGSPMGRYDEEGYYCTHLPPISGAEGARALSRYVRHPLANEQAKAEYERDLMYERHGRGVAA